MASPMLHKHEAQSLLDKVDENFEEARIYLIGILPRLYKQFQHILNHSNDAQRDEAHYLESARYFIQSSTARSIYFGQFTDGTLDQMTREAFKPIRRSKRVKTEQVEPPLEQLVEERVKALNALEQQKAVIKTPFEQLVEDLQLSQPTPTEASKSLPI